MNTERTRNRNFSLIFAAAVNSKLNFLGYHQEDTSLSCSHSLGMSKPRWIQVDTSPSGIQCMWQHFNTGTLVAIVFS